MNALEHATDACAQEAQGAVQAQGLIAAVQDESMTAGEAWNSFVNLASEWSWHSPACRAFVVELAKRAAA